MLLDENTRAHAEELFAHEHLTRAQARVARATEARLAADRACAGRYAGWGARLRDRPQRGGGSR